MTGVAVIDDHPLYRQGLAVAIEAAPGMDLVVAARSVEDFDAHRGVRPDVVILDLHLPGLEGSQAVAHLCQRGLAVLVVSASDDQDAVLDAMAAGASGYLTKDAEATELTAAVAAIAGGGTYVSPALAAYLLRAARTQPKAVPWALTEREREILRLLASGETDQDIAAQLYISVRTVRSHLERIRDKTGRRRRPDLTRLAIEQGLMGGDTGPEKR
jgi:DNA-binding NarL/FixJ family response regulator